MAIAGSEDAGRVSLSESLARGLVQRLTGMAKSKAKSLGCELNVKQTVKRAAAYRSMRDGVLKTVPEQLRALVAETDPSGKSKKSVFTVLHWLPGDAFKVIDQKMHGDDRELLLVFTALRAGSDEAVCQSLATLTNHALQRLYYRLKTTDDSQVLLEMRALAKSVYANIWILSRMGDEAQILVPTPRGAFVVKLDSAANSEFAVVTFMSDARMSDNVRRLHAVAVARREMGVVLNHTECFTVLSGLRPGLVRGPGEYGSDAGSLNKLCDQSLPERMRLEADWRFRDWQRAAGK